VILEQGHYYGKDQWSLGLGFDGLLQKAGPILGLSMGLEKPITKCGNCERGEPRESNISRLYVEMGV
jgi:hypothetical protein